MVTPMAPAPTEEIVTSTPSTTPVSTVSGVVRRGDGHEAGAGKCQELPAKYQRQRGEQQHRAKQVGDDTGRGNASYVEAGDKQQRQRRSGHAAGRKQADAR
jgi:hypothetical protein